MAGVAKVIKIEMTIELDKTKGKLKLIFAYRKELVEAVKSLPDRAYNPNDKSWSVGFDETNLSEILALLAGCGWESRRLDEVEVQARAYLQQNVGKVADFRSPIIKLGELVIAAYIRGDITQGDQILMLSLLNHLSLKDFVKY